jgi:ferric-dicitrate binding protein FerR (iron transport regulator)
MNKKAMLNETQIKLLIIACLTGKATGEEHHILETWAKADPEHLRYYQEFANIWQITHPAFNPDGIDVAKAMQRMNRKIPGTNIVRTLWNGWQRAAAIIIIPLLLLSAYLLVNDRTDGNEATGYQELKSPHGMFSRTDLPDGTKVWLNGGSTLRYPLKFHPRRSVFLEGEAYFEVHSDRKNPFTVQTHHMTLTATGTAFNVEAYACDSMTAITMAGGVVDVDFGKTAAPLTLKSGDRVLYNSLTSKRTVLKTDPYKWYAWKDGQMIFRNDPLHYVFKRLEQNFNVEIILKDTEIAHEPYRASFRDESLDEILRLLEMSAPIRFVLHKRNKTENQYYEKQRIEVYKRKSGRRNTTSVQH